MSEDDFLNRWDAEIAALAGDREHQHGEADQLLVAALRQLGWNRLADKWDMACDRWWWA